MNHTTTMSLRMPDWKSCMAGSLVHQDTNVRTNQTQSNYTGMQHPLCLTHHVSYPLNVNDPSDGLQNESGVNESDYCGCRCVICVTCNLIPKIQPRLLRCIQFPTKHFKMRQTHVFKSFQAV